MHQERAPNRHVPVNTSQGWGVALLIVGLAVAFNVWSTWVHLTTFRHPRNDIGWSYRGPEGAHAAAPSGEHGEAVGGHGETAGH